MEKQVVGSLFGSANPRADIPKLLELYREGQLDLDGLVTKTYTLDGVNDGYDAMRAGKNIRGVMVYDLTADELDAPACRPGGRPDDATATACRSSSDRSSATEVVGRDASSSSSSPRSTPTATSLLEGPPGTGKSTLLRAVADELGVGFEFVEGNAELTPARLVGHFDPARVLADGLRRPTSSSTARSSRRCATARCSTSRRSTASRRRRSTCSSR